MIRGAVHSLLVAGFLLGFTSVMLHQSKTLGLCGMGIVLAAALMGGSRVPVGGDLHDDVYLLRFGEWESWKGLLFTAGGTAVTLFSINQFENIPFRVTSPLGFR